MKQGLSVQDKSLIHIKFEYIEMLQSKKDVLETKRSIIKMIRSAQNYRSLRNYELKIRLQIYKKFKSLNSILKKIQKSIPNIEIPKEISSKKISSQPRKTKEKYNNSLEKELQEIQKKLEILQSKNL